MATSHDTTDTGSNAPADALSALYEANNLLDVLQDGIALKTPSYTLTGEIKRRLDAAIAHLDGAVPHPADTVTRAHQPDSGGFTIPEVLEKNRADQSQWAHDAYMAAKDHAKYVRKAENTVTDAEALAETLRIALNSGEDYDIGFASGVLRQIVAKLERAQAQMDKHGREHTNLFLAYFDRDREPMGGAA